jgi:hypothetical protein
MGLNQLRLDIQSGRRAGSVISSTSLQEAREGDETVWRDIGQALEDVGISDETVKEHRDFIVAWLCKALKEGQLEEQPPGMILLRESDQSRPYDMSNQESEISQHDILSAAWERLDTQVGKDFKDHHMSEADTSPNADRLFAEIEDVDSLPDTASVQDIPHREGPRSIRGDQHRVLVTQCKNALVSS